MRILVISTPVFQLGNSGLVGYGGLEMIAWQVAKGLAERGHAVSLLAPDGSTCPGVEIIPCGPAGRIGEDTCYGGWHEQISDDQSLPEDKRRRYHDGYWKLLPQFDCIIDHSWSKHAYLLKQEGKLKAPILAVHHAPIASMYASLPAVDKYCAVCISIDQAAHFEALFNRPARVAYNGINLDTYKPLGIPRSKRYLFLARFSSIKGPLIALESARRKGVGLDLVGDTQITQEPELYEECRRRADGKQIRIIGGVPRGEAVWWYSQAHALLHPNKIFREPFGLAPVEAQACGLPVCGWDYGAMRETIKHGETGFLCRSEEEMVGYMDQVEGINREWCREWVSQFSVERMVGRYSELCEEAVSTGGW